MQSAPGGNGMAFGDPWRRRCGHRSVGGDV